tara:strand:- start:3917 stop:4321 length:405 start_codon:yes stop_codon:yes gene_type:complete
MSFSISLIINLKRRNISSYENIIKEASQNCNVSSIFYDFDMEGINNYIKKNNKIIILGFDKEIDFINFLKFIINIKELIIEYIYYENSILYCSKEYLNNISNTLHNKTNLLNKIELNKNSNNYKKIYDILGGVN